MPEGDAVQRERHPQRRSGRVTKSLLRGFLDYVINTASYLQKHRVRSYIDVSGAAPTGSHTCNNITSQGRGEEGSEDRCWNGHYVVIEEGCGSTSPFLFAGLLFCSRFGSGRSLRVVCASGLAGRGDERGIGGVLWECLCR